MSTQCSKGAFAGSNAGGAFGAVVAALGSALCPVWDQPLVHCFFEMCVDNDAEDQGATTTLQPKHIGVSPSLSVGARYFLVNRWRTGMDYRAGMMLGFSGNDVVLEEHENGNRSSVVPWEVRHIDANRAYLINRGSCTDRAGWMLSFHGDAVQLDEGEPDDAVPWEFVRVPADHAGRGEFSGDCFFLVNRWRPGCDGRYGRMLGFCTKDVRLEREIDARNMIPWELVRV